MIKNFVVKQFTTLLDVFFVVGAVISVIVGLVIMFAGGNLQAFILGLLYMIFLLISLIIWFGVIYLLVDIRDTLKLQSNAKHFE